MRVLQQYKRGRGRGTNGGNGNFGRKNLNPLVRNYDSNGYDVKIRGTAQQIAERYSSLARDAMSAGDYVVAENHLQHAEHYNRLVSMAQAQMQEKLQRDEQANLLLKEQNSRTQNAPLSSGFEEHTVIEEAKEVVFEGDAQPNIGDSAFKKSDVPQEQDVPYKKVRRRRSPRPRGFHNTNKVSNKSAEEPNSSSLQQSHVVKEQSHVVKGATDKDCVV
ncbi:DUF4167 domain-containing protein [Candidatus Liberibacter africanus]|uniref:DUF4167 domain-containing protein n=1 Tax=Candidatus Liberibacter africanus PTSAPSY TaxID=1277257 RepID=A0A0G3I1L4_LIBAF|nr:DUF4167 domain-containing protein [Candidatus Liberibacter africanus]AKK19766.1 hypothetical protein G293_00600 [Candidatus Liberibacter africanus PTSAPSY]QTP63640.1 DUF4167 domain-containing protein [Candidatus Liberibacter africanus]